MVQISSLNLVEFLVRRKFSDYTALNAVRSISGSSGIPYERREQRLKELEAYRSELKSKPNEDLEKLYSREKSKEHKELKAKARLEEDQRFFNRPDAVADFAHWSKAAHWTLDEAVALSFGKAPEVVKWESVKEYINVSPFAVHYGKVRDLALRAKQWQQLDDLVLPGVFLAWAKRIEIDYPPELEKQVIARGHNVGDWKSRYDELKVQSDKDIAAAKVLVAEKDDLIAGLTQESNTLRERVAELELAIQNAPKKEKPLLTRERDSALKLIIGMAVRGYGYYPTAARSDITKDISDDLALLGISLDADTVRKWLREGADLLPPPRKPRRP